MDPLSVINELQSDQAFRALDVPTQMEIASRRLDELLPNDPDYQALDFQTQRLVKNRLLAKSPTFTSMQLDSDLKTSGTDYINGGSYGGTERTLYEGVQGAIEGSGILSFIRTQLSSDPGEVGKDDLKRGLDYYKALDNILHRDSTPAAIGNFVGATAEAIGISLAMTPLTNVISKGVAGVLAGDKVLRATAGAAKLAPKLEAAGAFARAGMVEEAATTLHPALSMMGKIGADAVTTAAPFYFSDELRRYSNGEPSIVSEGYGEVLKTLGENAAMNFVIGSLGVGALATLGKTAKIVFNMKDAGNVIKGTFEENKDFIRAYMATGDDILRSKMDPIVRDKNDQLRNVLAYIKEGVIDPDVVPLIKTQWLAQNTGKIVGRLDDGRFRVWEFGEKNEAIERVYTNLNDATNYLAYKTYKEWSILDDAGKSKFPPHGLEWSLQRGEALAKQEDLLASHNIDLDPMLAPYGKSVANVKERIVVSKAEADFFASSTSDYIGVQAHLPLKGTIAENAKSGEFNLFKGSDSVRVTISDEPNVVLVGTKPASDADYAYAIEKANEAINLEPSLALDSARTSILLDKGFDYYKHPDGSVEFFAPRNAKLIGTIDDVLKDAPSRMRTSGSVDDRIIVEVEAKAQLSSKDFTGNSDAVLNATIRALRSDNSQDLLSVVNAYLEGFEMKLPIVAEKVNGLKRVQFFHTDEGGYRLRFPAQIESPLRERQYVKELFDNLKEVTKGKAAASHSGTYFADRLDSDVARFGFGKDFNNEAWADNVAKKLGGTLNKTDNGFELELPSGTKTFSTIDDVVDFIAKHTADPTLVRKDLLLQGVKLSQIKRGWSATYINSSKVVADDTLVGLMEKINYAPKFVDRRFGPKEVSISSDGITFDVAGAKVTRSLKEALQTLDKFKDTNLLARQQLLKASDKGELSVDPTANYRVYLSKYGYVKNFDNVKDARKFLEQEVPQWHELQDIADKKRLDLTRAEDGRYKVQEGSTTYYATSKEELQDIFTKYPDIEESVPDLLDALDPNISIQVSHVVAAHKQASLRRVGVNKNNQPPSFSLDPMHKDLGAWTTFRQYTSQKFQWFLDATQRGNRPSLMKMVHRVRDARRLAERSSYLFNKIADKVFRDDGGKVLSMQSKRNIFYHVGQSDDEATKALLGQYKRKFKTDLPNLTPIEQRSADRLNELYDKLFELTDMDARKFIYKYQPMLRDAKLGAEFLNSNPNADVLAQHAFHGNVPKVVKFMAEYERTGAIFNYDLKDDPLELLLMYSAQLHKKMYLNPVWKDIVQYMDINKDTLEQPFQHQLNIWREQIMGYYHSPGEKVAEDVGIAFMRNLKNVPLFKTVLKNVSQETMEGYGRSMLRNAMSLTYLVQMGFRPWVAVRNTLQPFTTLSMRYGVSWTLKAYDDVAKLGTDYFEHLRFLGILADHPPIVDEVAFANTFLGKATRKGLQWMKNSDDLTRAVAYRTADLRFENALKVYNVNKDLKQFHTLSGLSISPPQETTVIMDLLQKGQIASAKDTFGYMVVQATMFPNDAAESSLMRSGLIGKLFGQYGSYSEAYRANMFNMLKYGSAADRVRMVATYLAICGTFSATFDELGIKTNDFVPVAPAAFTGGPGFYMALNLLKSGKAGVDWVTGNLTNTDQRALSDTLWGLKGFVPGSYQWTYFKKAEEYANDGDSWRSFLSMTGVPTQP